MSIRRLTAALWTVIAIFLAILFLADYSNNRMIEKYKNGIYEQNPLGFLGFVEPHVNHYNRGNVFYSLGLYERAQEEYELAMRSHLDEPSDCRLRVNLALSMVEQINPDQINDDNLQQVLEILDEARDILCENGCASRDDNSGHYPDAQRLKNEIDEFEASLLNPPEEEQTPDETPTPTPTPSPTETPTPTPEGGEETPTPTPEGGEDTPTPTPEGGEDTPTPTPEDGDTPTPTPSDENGTPTPTPDGGEGGPTPTPGGEGGNTPTPTLTPEQQILDLQAQAQNERYEGANGVPDDPYGAFNNSGTPW